MLSQGRNREFGRRSEPHRIIIAHGDTVQDFTIRPWVMTAVIGIAIVFSVLYLSATSYLVFRDEIISFSRSEQAVMQSAYEDKIAQLRTQLDRLASRQMIDQQKIETHVQHLMRKQADFEAYSTVLEPIIEKARKAGMEIRTELKVPLPRSAPWRKAAQNEAPRSDSAAALKALEALDAKPSAPDMVMASAYQSPTSISSRFEELTALGFRSSQPMARNDATGGPENDETASYDIASVEPLGLSLDQPSIIETSEDVAGNETIVKLADAASRLDTEMLESQAILHNLLSDLRNKTNPG